MNLWCITKLTAMTNLHSGCHKVRIVPDTRVSAFTYAEALKYLKEHNHLYRDFTWDMWLFLQLDPDKELLQAVDDYWMPLAYAELKNKYPELAEKT